MLIKLLAKSIITPTHRLCGGVFRTRPTIAGAFLFVNFWTRWRFDMNIEEQVELLMQGTEYGDEELKKAMTE